MERIKNHVDEAFAALCQIQVSGPAAIPYAKAVQELAEAGLELKKMLKEEKTAQKKDGGGET